MKRILFAFLTVIILFTAQAVPSVQAGDCDVDLYTVKKGESLTIIAQKCGIELIVLMNINYEISDPNLIRPGQKIRLTAEVPIAEYVNRTGPAVSGGSQQDGTYVVRKGDSLALIAYLYNTTVPELLRANPQLGGRYVIYAGERLNLPQAARQYKGWVGVSTLKGAYSDEVEARTQDFPPYVRVQFRLHYLPAEGSEDNSFDTDYYSITAIANTDARGEAHAVLIIPYWAYEGETWIIDAIDLDSSQSVKASSPRIKICDVVYDSSIASYRYVCP